MKLVHGIEGVLDGVPKDSGVIEYFEIISAFSSFIPKEMNFTEIVFFQVTQAEGLVPTLREGIDRNLATDGILQAVIGEFGFKGLDQIETDRVGLVEFFKGQTFFVRTIATDWRNVDHGVAEFDKTSTFNWEIQVGNVTKNEID